MAGNPIILKLVVPGGLNEVEGHLVGELRELRADEDNDSLRLHDGVKEGGYEFLNRDENDTRYQFHSVELDGFDFGAQEKGIVTRVGPGQYKIRKLTVNEGDFNLENPRGTADNFYFELQPTITTIHTWSATQTYVERIIAQDGLDGDTFGTHHGDVIGGTFTGTGIGDFSGTFVGDVDVRGHEFITDPGQILETQIDPEAWIRRGLPLGAIVMWSGIVADIPESFALCDGDNGTPDLRNQFILGAGTGSGIAAPGSTGGSATSSGVGTIAASGAHVHPLAIDDHELTIAEMPAHHHGCGIANDDTQALVYGNQPATNGQNMTTNTVDGTLEGLTETIGGGLGHSHTGNTTESGAHTHDLTLDDIDIIPPYFALCFIMKIV